MADVLSNVDGKISGDQVTPLSTNTEQQNRQYEASGGANDDKTSTANVGATNNTTGTATSSTTQSNDNSNTGGSKPGKRPYNPLGKLFSYTYNLSLYMISPEAYDAFVQSGRRNLNALGTSSTNQAAGVYLIAQSGGINNSNEKRAPGFELDYYIDNLRINAVVAPAASGAATFPCDFSFNIIEPYGFSFITNLKRAQDSLQQYMEQTGRSQKGLQNPTRQFYILGIRFTGYDSQGNVITNSTTGKDIDPTADDNGIFQTYYDIVFTSVKFKLTGKIVTYTVNAAFLPNKEAFGTKRGLVDTGATIEAGNVYEALMGDKGLIKKLNDEQQRLYNAGSIGKPDKYNVIFLSDMEERMKAASIVSPADLDKYKWGGSGAKKTDESNDATANKAPPNNNVRNVVIQGTTPVIQAITQVISQSSYLEDALKVVYTTNLEPNTQKKTENEIKKDSKNVVKWFNISSQVSNSEWDEKRADFAMTITYLIAPYETPIIMSAYTNPGAKYYGPFKRYEYWYTGKNSEIIQYEHTLDTAYYNVALVPSTSGDQGKGGPIDVPLKPNQRTNMPRLGRTDVGAEAQNSYVTSLYDPASWVEAKIQILGDPDFLVQVAEISSGVGTAYNRFYGPNGYSIKPTGGQVFIEIDFKEAIDYEHNNGVLKINESILFWKYPESISKEIKGISYHVITVESNFTQGKFTQLLTCRLNSFPDAKDDTGKGRESVSTNTTGPSAADTSTTSSEGLLADKAFEIKPAISGAGAIQPNQPSNSQTTTRGVQDDDSSSGVSATTFAGGGA